MCAVNINRVILTGKVIRDPELHDLPSGACVCNLRVTCSTPSGGCGSDKARAKINYFDIKVYGEQAELVKRNIFKGHTLAVEGRLEWRELQTIEGHQIQAVSIVADALHLMLDGDRVSGGPALAAQHGLSEIDMRWGCLVAAA
jgi:single-strand DNA-binding protein